MRLKNKQKFLFLIPLVLGFILYSCVEEPTIAPVGPVYSVLKIANMSNNVDVMNVSIDGKQVATSLGRGETTEYFDSNAGKLLFTVTDGAGNKLYEKTIDINTWERTDVIFAGDYISDPLLSTFADFEINEGEIYVSSAPAPDSLNIYFVHASNDVDTLKSKSYNISAKIVSPDTFITYASSGSNALPLKFGGTYSVGNAAPGEYTFHFAIQSTTDTVVAGPYNLAANLRYYLYLYGNPNNLQFSLKEVVPPPIRSRD
jgi:hypothetical protein